MEEDSCSKIIRWGPDPVPTLESATKVVAEGKHYHATDCCDMQCCETTHSFVHHLDSSFDVQGKSTVIAAPVAADVPEMMSSGLMTLAPVHL